MISMTHCAVTFIDQSRLFTIIQMYMLCYNRFGLILIHNTCELYISQHYLTTGSSIWLSLISLTLRVRVHSFAYECLWSCFLGEPSRSFFDRVDFMEFVFGEPVFIVVDFDYVDLVSYLGWAVFIRMGLSDHH